MLWKLNKPVHTSWLVAGFSLGVVVAIVLVPSFFAGIFLSVSWLLVGMVLMIWGLIRQRRWCFVLVIIGGLLIGGWRGGVAQFELSPYRAFAGYTVTTKGVVGEDVDVGAGGDLVLRLKNVAVDGHSLPGSLWVTTGARADIKRSDIVYVKGKVSEGFGGFAGSIYRAELIRVERPTPGDVARQLRDGFADKIRSAIPEPQASLGIGYLVGQRRSLPPELDEALKVVGLTHIVVASGYNLTILVRLARRLFVKVSKYLAALSAGSMVVAFIAVTGLSPSMSRAGLVAGLSLLAWYYGRKFHPLVLLPFAAAVTLLINPSYGWNDLGWQLSFAAFTGVMILAPLLQAYFFGDEKPGTVRQILGETVSAQIMTLPIIAVAFGVVSNVAVAANLLVLPLVPLAMLLTFLAGVGSMLLPGVAELIAWPAAQLLGYMTKVATWLASSPWAQAEISVSGIMAGFMYVVIGCTCLYMWRKTGYSLRNHNIVE